MPSSWYSGVVDAADIRAQGAFWAAVLDWQVDVDDDDEVSICPPGTFGEGTPGLTFVPVPEGKTVKNRLHIDLNPTDQAAEVERLLALGATHADVGQGEQTWVVLADPEGNEFCVLSAR